MPSLRVAEEKLTIRVTEEKPTIRNAEEKPTIRKSFRQNRLIRPAITSTGLLQGGMPLGLLMAITYSENQTIRFDTQTEIIADDVSIALRIEEKPVNIRLISE